MRFLACLGVMGAAVRRPPPRQQASLFAPARLQARASVSAAACPQQQNGHHGRPQQPTPAWPRVGGLQDAIVPRREATRTVVPGTLQPLGNGVCARLARHAGRDALGFGAVGFAGQHGMEFLHFAAPSTGRVLQLGAQVVQCAGEQAELARPEPGHAPNGQTLVVHQHAPAPRGPVQDQGQQDAQAPQGPRAPALQQG